jgi:glycosyltransferase involved in cell wall biosynthesis
MMRILMISWEYPPGVIGGLGQHVAQLLLPLGRLGAPPIDVHLVTPRWHGGPPRERVGQVVVHRVEPISVADDYYATAWQTNLGLEESIRQLWQAEGPIDLVHVHDWNVSFAGRAVRERYGIPLLSTIHATERGRRRGHLYDDLARAIDQAERELVAASWRIIACSEYMRQEISRNFGCPPAKIDVIPNGVETARFDELEDQDLEEFRQAYALPSEHLVFSVGRLVYEKGFHVLVGAMPQILAHCPRTKVVVAGRGPELECLRSLAENMGLAERILFPGFIADDLRDRLLKVADCAVFPSLYEPFGIVALEAMAARCPVVVSDVGGLADVVTHDETGLTIYPDDAGSLAWGVIQALEYPEAAHARAAAAYRLVREEYNWTHIARRTAAVYERIVAERMVQAA